MKKILFIAVGWVLFSQVGVAQSKDFPEVKSVIFQGRSILTLYVNNMRVYIPDEDLDNCLKMALLALNDDRFGFRYNNLDFQCEIYKK